MRKYYKYGLLRQADGSAIIGRFRNLADAEYWEKTNPDGNLIPSTHPELRRIVRRIEAGEKITFPVVVE